MREFTPETVHLLSEQEINAHAERAWSELYAKLESILKYIDPAEWAQEIAMQFRTHRDPMNHLKSIPALRSRPPHLMLRSIEASAGYWARPNAYGIIPEAFNHVMWLYMSHNDPMTLSFAAKSIPQLMIVMSREQLVLQIRFDLRDLARLWLIFVQGDPLPTLTEAFRRKYQMTPRQWLMIAYGAFASAALDPQSQIECRKMKWMAADMFGVSDIAAFVKSSVWTVGELGEHYRQTRKETPAAYHVFIRHAFLERPILDIGNDVWLSPDPFLIYGHLTNSLYTMMAKLWAKNNALREEFSNSVAKHVGRVLACHYAVVKVSGWTAVEEVAGTEKSCDFIVETHDEILVVESKSVMFERNRLFPQWMQQDLSTDRIIDSIEQHRATYKGIQNGMYASFIADQSKPVMFITSTFGDVPFANTSWYFDKVIQPRATSRGVEVADELCGLPAKPIVLDLATLELLITASNYFRLPIHKLAEEKGGGNEFQIGEWVFFLTRKLSEHDDVPPLPFIDTAQQQFHDEVERLENERVAREVAGRK